MKRREFLIRSSLAGAGIYKWDVFAHDEKGKALARRGIESFSIAD